MNIVHNKNTVEPGYNDIGLYGTSSIASDTLRYQINPLKTKRICFI
jgi:hypothetical protein